MSRRVSKVQRIYVKCCLIRETTEVIFEFYIKTRYRVYKNRDRGKGIEKCIIWEYLMDLRVLVGNGFGRETQGQDQRSFDVLLGTIRGFKGNGNPVFTSKQNWSA